MSPLSTPSLCTDKIKSIVYLEPPILVRCSQFYVPPPTKLNQTSPVFGTYFRNSSSVCGAVNGECVSHRFQRVWAHARSPPPLTLFLIFLFFLLPQRLHLVATAVLSPSRHQSCRIVPNRRGGVAVITLGFPTRVRIRGDGRVEIADMCYFHGVKSPPRRGKDYWDVAIRREHYFGYRDIGASEERTCW